ncbi:MAG: SAM-dependent methyltransferase [Alteromonas macleodii]
MGGDRRTADACWVMWEDRFSAKDGYLFGVEPAGVLMANPWLALPSKSVLCVADGEGRNAVHLARSGMHVTSFDLSVTAVGRSNALAKHADVVVQTHVSDWGCWDWTQKFDMVVGIFIQFVGPELRAKQFMDMKRALQSGGRLFLHGYRPEQIGRGTGGPPTVENMYTEVELHQAFAGWTVERSASYECEQASGSAHVGKAALIDFVARKP